MGGCEGSPHAESPAPPYLPAPLVKLDGRSRLSMPRVLSVPNMPERLRGRRAQIPGIPGEIEFTGNPGKIGPHVGAWIAPGELRLSLGPPGVLF